jgi:hypothetical protein
MLSFAKLLSLLVLGLTAVANSQPLVLDEPDGSSSANEANEMAEIGTAPTQPRQSDVASKRLFGVIPNYRAEQTWGTYQPLTTTQKYHIARSDSFDWPNYFLLAGYAVQSQVVSGGFSHNGGAAGFAKFYARSLGDQIIGSYVTEAILPSLLHEDPRFFRLGTGTFWHRSSYATSRVFITRMDNGKARFNVSELAGNAGVVAVTALYYPDSRSATAGVERYGMQLGNDAISNLLTEFWPDLRRHLRFQHFYSFSHSPQR